MNAQPNITVHLPSLESTHLFAKWLAEHAMVPMVICLEGTLGAGKTEWTRAFVTSLGVDPRDVTSPTFMLMHQYPSNPPVYHLDVYRLNHDDEFYELGVDELFEESCICIIEWASRVQEALPLERLEVRLDVLAESERRATLIAFGPRHQAWLASCSLPNEFPTHGASER
jgi:tRNA threonylcarbamoyladenosine biosynthesis protein TsaE